MTEKKTKAGATAKKATAKSAQVEKKVPVKQKATASKKSSAQGKTVIDISAENIGFKAGDVYQALATKQKAMSVADLSKAAALNEQEVLLGMGWLFKEGKIKGDGKKVSLA